MQQDAHIKYSLMTLFPDFSLLLNPEFFSQRWFYLHNGESGPMKEPINWEREEGRVLVGGG
jgi:hypothetical protein